MPKPHVLGQQRRFIAAIGLLIFSALSASVRVQAQAAPTVTGSGYGLGLGVRFFFSPKQALTLGYKLHHISNANTGRSNPGMDSHVVYAGFSFFTS